VGRRFDRTSPLVQYGQSTHYPQTLTEKGGPMDESAEVFAMLVAVPPTSDETDPNFGPKYTMTTYKGTDPDD